MFGSWESARLTVPDWATLFNDAVASATGFSLASMSRVGDQDMN